MISLRAIRWRRDWRAGRIYWRCARCLVVSRGYRLLHPTPVAGNDL
jgi:hypothetical protein